MWKYEILEPVFDAMAAIAPGAPLLHDDFQQNINIHVPSMWAMSREDLPHPTTFGKTRSPQLKIPISRPSRMQWLHVLTWTATWKSGCRMPART